MQLAEANSKVKESMDLTALHEFVVFKVSVFVKVAGSKVEMPEWKELLCKSNHRRDEMGKATRGPVAQPGNTAARKSAARSLSQSSHGSTGAGASTRKLGMSMDFQR
jgi:hypothetical protein